MTMNNLSAPALNVLICTYRRPELLRKALHGIERAAKRMNAVEIIVVDNDAKLSAQAITTEFSLSTPLKVKYLSQPIQNISLTRNMALSHATAPWIALIDDDEVPDESWLSNLMQTATSYEADVVFGPVISEFDQNAPEWASKGTLFQRPRFATGFIVPINQTRTSNVLIRMDRFAKDAFRFDPALGLSGGEDSEFFGRLARSGYKMVWCDDACVREMTPLARTKIAWILKRGFRIGSVDAFNKRRFRQWGAVARTASKAVVFIGSGIVLSVCLGPFSSKRSVHALFLTALGAGIFYGIGKGPYTEYRTPVAKTKGGAAS